MMGMMGGDKKKNASMIVSQKIENDDYKEDMPHDYRAPKNTMEPDHMDNLSDAIYDAVSSGNKENFRKHMKNMMEMSYMKMSEKS